MSLEIITQAIENAKVNLRDNGFFYLLWGWLVLGASLLQFILISYTAFPQPWIGWIVLMPLGGIVSAIYGYRLGKNAKVVTHVDKAMIYLWYGFLVAMIIIIAMSSAGRINWQLLNPIIIVLFSLGTFVSGGILKFKPLIIGGVLSWVVAVFAFFVQSEHQLLLTALAVTIAYLIPGYMLKYRKSHV